MNRHVAFVFGVLSAGAVLAQEPPPETSVPPEARPELETPSEYDSPDDAAEDAADDEAVAVPGESLRELLREDDATYASCLEALEARGTVFVPANPVQEATDADCGIARPVTVTEIVPGVKLQPDGVMRCDAARALAKWVDETVMPAADALDHGALVGLDHGSTYICRRRNNLPDGKLSQHALGNAIDIMNFRFDDGPDVPVMPRAEEGTMEEAFQRAVRSSGCLFFTTVLGPGSDEYHDDHLHMDVIDRDSGYRLCQ